MRINIRVLFQLIIIAAIIIPAKLFSQSDYERQMVAFSVDLARKIKESSKVKVAVSDFLDNDGNLTELGKAIAEDIGVEIVNEGKGTFQVMERSNLNAILKEQKLASTGLIDPETAKQLGKLKMVDAVIVGNITPFGNSFRVTIKILDTETGMSIAAAAGNLAGTDDIKGLFNKKITLTNQTSQTINTDSSIVNKTVNQDCEKNNTGDYCFYNSSEGKVILRIYGKYGTDDILTSLSLNPKESKCIYGYLVGSYGFYAFLELSTSSGDAGQILIEKCKSKLYIIKISKPN
jgi:hypothetical protein